MRRRRITVTVVLEGDSQVGTAHRRAEHVKAKAAAAAATAGHPFELRSVDSKVELLRPTADGWEPA